MSRYTQEGEEKIRLGNELRFLHAARAKFGDRFDYSLVRYQRQKLPVTIVCPDHGPFQQTPDKHLRSAAGCPKCGVNIRSRSRIDSSRETFQTLFREKHGDRLELISEYVKAREPIKCRCKIHGIEFESVPDRLMQVTYGCPRCAQEGTSNGQMMTQAEFLQRAKEKFGTQFDLSGAVYAGMNKKVAIVCRIHGEFRTTPVSFLQNTHGCPKCGRLYVGHAENRIKRLEQGITKPRPTTIAVMKIEAFGITGYKVGITARSLLARYREALREILFEATLNELDALKLERAIHAKYFRNRDVRIFLAGLRAGERWSGDSEIYDAALIPALIEELNKAITEIAKGSEDYWKQQPELAAPILRIRTVRKIPGVYNGPKPVIRLDTLERFPSAKEAADSIGASPGNLSTVCLGKRGSIKGIRFAYVSDYEVGTIPQFQQRRQGKSNPRARSVRCVETGEIFDTVSDAARASGAHSGKIVAVCKGSRKRAGGFSWEYINE